MHVFLDFETQIADLEGKIEELRQVATQDPSMNIGEELAKLEAKAAAQLRDTYAKLTPWQKTQVARHPVRPHFNDYVSQLVEDFTALAGDRCFGEDTAIIAGFGRFEGRSIALIGHEKGADTQSRLEHNFGMARPEGYRKAVRIMALAEQFSLPVVTLVDTTGAYPGRGAEERGQAEAIARSTEKCLSLGVPLVSVIIGEGGSGGAVALAAANRVLMLEHAVYSVISPEGCASILWRDSERIKDAAAAMKITAQNLAEFNVIDQVIPEPLGGAHRDPVQAIKDTGGAINNALQQMDGWTPQALRQDRRVKFLEIGRAGLV